MCPKPKNKHFLLLYQAREPFPSKISIGKILVCKKIIELECVYILICIYIYCATVYDDYVRRQQEYREQDEEVNVYIIIILFLFFLLEHTKDFFLAKRKIQKNTLKVFHIIYSQHTDIFLHGIQPRNVLYEEV